MKTLTLIAAALLLTACGKSGTPFSLAAAVTRAPLYDPQVLSYAVLDVLQKALPIDTMTDDPLSVTEGLCDLKLISAEREWVRTSIKDTQLKAKYLDWLDYYDRQVHRRMSPEVDKEKERNRNQIAEGRVLAEDLPTPPIPKEQCEK